MYELKYLDKALKQLAKLDTQLQTRILKTLERIRIRPHSFLKSLSGSPYFRLRIGDYRIILDIKNNKLIIIVVDIVHRKNIYK